MEVAGIEPASEDVSIEATTCLSQVFRFIYQTLPCKIQNRLSQKQIRRLFLEKKQATSPYCDALAGLTSDKTAKRSRVIKQLVLILDQQL